MADPLRAGHPLLAPVRRAGRLHPVGIVRAPVAAIDDTIVDDGRPVAVDPELLADGAAHVTAARARVPGLFNGPVLAFRALEGGRILAGRSDYLTMLATSGALQDEPAGAGPRLRAVRAAGGDPVRSGAGRAAVVGVTVVVTMAARGRPLIPLGLRRTDLAIEPGRWGLVAGAVEPGAASPLRAAIAGELAGEVPGLLAAAGTTAGDAAAAARPLGVVVNLRRLSPSACVAVHLALDAAPDPEAVMDATEFTEVTLVPATAEGLDAMWRTHGARLTVNAAGALAAWEAAQAGGER